MMDEDWVPLLTGAFLLESRMKACTSGDSGNGLVLGIRFRHCCTRSVSAGIITAGNQWIKQINFFVIIVVGDREPRGGDNAFGALECKKQMMRV